MSAIFDAIGNVNWEVVGQLLGLALIVLAGPAVIVVLASRGGDL